jgi:NADH:ubiquinone oxidoreductase subunit K
MSELLFVELSALLFAIGLVLVLVKRNPILMLVGVELMLNAANINFIAFHRDSEGQIMALFVIVIAAVEVVVLLAILRNVFQHFKSLDLDTTEKQQSAD